jgi:hypothetical protein
MPQSSLSPNALAFIGLCNEYCAAIEHAREAEREDFINQMLRLLPRIYIAASDLQEHDDFDDAYIVEALDEDYYDAMRRNVELIMGEDDSYLEVFEEDMKYSDTPIAASISECLADIFQSLFNFLETVRDATDELIISALGSIKEDFCHYWSSKLCNVLRAINHVKYSVN